MKRIIIGYFGASHGIKGWLKIKSIHQPLSSILQFKELQIYHQDAWQPIKITAGKQQSNSIIVKIAECDTPEVAKTYTHDPIAIFREQLPPLPPNEYYWEDLIGLEVFNQEKISLGIIDHFLETGSNDVMVLKSEKKRLVPYTEQVVKSVDLTSKIIIVDWPSDF